MYCGSKFAVWAITEGLRLEALALGVHITDVSPGAAATEPLESVRHEGSRQAAIAAFYMPEARILQDIDVANAILYAVSQPSHVNVGELVIRPSTQEL